jgi:23S rRNA (uracil1939-C5)-methyltransferase
MPMLQTLFQDQGLCRLSVNGEMLFALETPVVTMGQARVPLPLATFLQATHNGENALAGLVADALAKSRMIADLFCGLGPFALRLAEAARVHAVDSEKPAVAALEQAVKNTQGLKPVSTEVRDLFRNPLVPQELNVFDGVVFDPPRAGAESQAKALAKSKVKWIAAVSCDAQTFARDARILIDGGYKLRTVTPIDQFKWTAHVEIVGAFTR